MFINWYSVVAAIIIIILLLFCFIRVLAAFAHSFHVGYVQFVVGLTLSTRRCVSTGKLFVAVSFFCEILIDGMYTISSDFILLKKKTII